MFCLKNNLPNMAGFTAEVHRRSPYDFVMIAKDPFHGLHGELPLKFEKNESSNGWSVICRFPCICKEEMTELIQEDETLFDMALTQFHLQVLKNLLLFCNAHNVNELLMQIDEICENLLLTYENFISSQKTIPTNKGVCVQMRIAVNTKAVHDCREFIEEMTEEFRQVLWQEKSSNSAIRDYLLSNARFSVVH
jgi:hypothetical protein